jgi:hypothetical protein
LLIRSILFDVRRAWLIAVLCLILTGACTGGSEQAVPDGTVMPADATQASGKTPSPADLCDPARRPRATGGAPLILSASPNPVRVGETVIVSASGFPPGQQVVARFIRPGSEFTSTPLATQDSDTMGAVTMEFTLPEEIRTLARIGPQVIPCIVIELRGNSAARATIVAPYAE